MKYFTELVGYIFLLGVWYAGVALANGFWSTLIAICFPPWSFYLFVEKVLIYVGWIT